MFIFYHYQLSYSPQGRLDLLFPFFCLLSEVFLLFFLLVVSFLASTMESNLVGGAGGATMKVPAGGGAGGPTVGRGVVTGLLPPAGHL